MTINSLSVPNNVLSRIAISLALESGESVATVVKDDAGGQTLSRDLLFGELLETFDVLIRQYIYEKSVKMSTAQAISALIEIGAHKMSYCRSIGDLCALGE